MVGKIESKICDADTTKLLYSSHDNFVASLGGTYVYPYDRARLVQTKDCMYIVSDTEKLAVKLDKCLLVDSNGSLYFGSDVENRTVSENKDDCTDIKFGGGKILLLCKQSDNVGDVFIEHITKGLSMLYHQHIDIVYLTAEGIPTCMDRLTHAMLESVAYVYMSGTDLEPEWIHSMMDMAGIKSLRGDY